MNKKNLTSKIKRNALELGFAKVGITNGYKSNKHKMHGGS